MYHPEVIYHVYNQSINRELVYREPTNYLYFLRKARKELLPMADILCYCLMPTHFHFMLKPTVAGCAPSRGRKVSKLPGTTDGEDVYQQQLSHTLRILLSSYTKAYNRKYDRRGSLFRARSRAKPAYTDFIPEAHELAVDAPFTLFVRYLKICFNYIHDNPVKDGLVQNAVDWKYSSARDYAGLRGGTLCNYGLTKQLLGINRGTLGGRTF